MFDGVDGLGSVAVGSDTAGNVQNSYSYDTWGVGRSSSESFSQPFRYTAREKGDALDQWFYRARVYTPTAGRFLSEDPLGFDSGDFNVYRYNFNAPTEFRDPLGLFSVGKSCDCDKTVDPFDKKTTSQRIASETSSFCNKNLASIRDPRARACVAKRCQSGNVECKWNCPENMFGGVPILLAPFTSTATVCGNTLGAAPGVAGHTVIHEWLHTCGWWSHGTPPWSKYPRTVPGVWPEISD